MWQVKHSTCNLPPSLLSHLQSKCNSKQDVAPKTLEATISYKTLFANAGTQMQKAEVCWRWTEVADNECFDPRLNQKFSET